MAIKSKVKEKEIETDNKFKKTYTKINRSLGYSSLTLKPVWPWNRFNRWCVPYTYIDVYKLMLNIIVNNNSTNDDDDNETVTIVEPPLVTGVFGVALGFVDGIGVTHKFFDLIVPLTTSTSKCVDIVPIWILSIWEANAGKASMIIPAISASRDVNGKGSVENESEKLLGIEKTIEFE